MARANVFQRLARGVWYGTVLAAALVWPMHQAAAMADPLASATPQLSHATPPLPFDVSSLHAQAPFLPHMQILRLPEHALRVNDASPDQVWRSTAWQTVDAAELRPRFEAAVWWLRASVVNRSGQAVTRWLVVDPWRLHDVQLYTLSPGGSQVLGYTRAGRSVPLAEREVADIDSLFPVTLQPGEQVDLLLRLQDGPIAFVDVVWTTPEQRQSQLLSGYSWESGLLGAVLTIGLFLCLQRDRRFTALALWLVAHAGFMALYNGHAYRVWLSDWLAQAYIVNFIAGGATLAAFGWVSHVLFHTARHPLWRVWYAGAPLLFFFIPLVWANDVAQARWLGLALGVSVYLLWPASLWVHLRGHLERQPRVLALFALHWLLELGTLTVLMGGAWPVTPDNVHLPVLALKLLTFLVMLTLYARVLTRSDQRLQERLREAEHQHRQELEHKVHLRTRDLAEALWLVDRSGQARNDFLLRIGHDLRSPLSSIVGYAQMMQTDATLCTQGSQVIQRTAQRMMGLINEMLEVGRGAGRCPVRMQPVALAPFFHELGEEMAPLVQSGGNVWRLELAPDLPAQVRTDGALLRRALVNLLGNATQSVQQGCISLQVDWQAPEAQGPSGRLRLVVADTGPGLPDAVRQRHFGPTAPPDAPWTSDARPPEAEPTQPARGWGLSNVRMMLEQLDGSFHFEPLAPWGSRFVVWLPVATPDPAPSQAASAGEVGRQAGSGAALGLTTDQWNWLVQRINMGARTDLLHWLDGLQAERTVPSPVLAELRERVEQGDFEGLKRQLSQGAGL